jgi:HKD family nuclease
MIKPGLYEQVINKLIAESFDENSQVYSTAPIDEEEASLILARYVAEVSKNGLDNVRDNGGDLQSQIELVNKIISLVKKETSNEPLDKMSIDHRAEQLLAIVNKTDSIYAIDDKHQIVRPETSIAQSSLFTGAAHEPTMYTELKKEILSCDRIDMLVSFIKWSGLRLIIDELREFDQNGGKIRVITTSYMGATDIKAIEELQQLHNIEIKVSYDTKRTRLHAKAYVFYRNTGFTTAYVGSSNLSNAAISSGLEWNVKITAKDQKFTIDKISATFENYWNSKEFEIYKHEEKERLEKALKSEKYFEGDSSQPYVFDITHILTNRKYLINLRRNAKYVINIET